MPNWKKVVTSGSNAQLNEVTSSLGVRTNRIEHLTSMGTISGIKFDSTDGEETLPDIDLIVRDQSMVNIDASHTTVSNLLKLNSGAMAGTDNTVLVLDSSNIVKTDEIDSRVWGSTLADLSNGVNNRVVTATDSNSLNGESGLTYDGSTLGVTGDINVSGEVEGSDNSLWCGNIYFTNKSTTKMNIGNGSYGWNHHNWSKQVTSASAMTINEDNSNCGVQVPYNLKKIKLKGQVRPSGDSPTISMMVFIGDRSDNTNSAISITEIIHINQSTTSGRFRNFDGEATVDVDEGQLIFIAVGFLDTTNSNTNAVKANFTISGTRRTS